MTDHYAVVGNPIHHSKSPLIHRAFAEQTAENIDYAAIEIPLDALEQSLKQLRDVTKLKGLNVTVPFKEQVWGLANHKSARAERAGAVNTVAFNNNGEMYGDNTDGVGLCRDLTLNHQIELAGKRILLLGAGGASRGVIAPLLDYQPSQLFIANRTAQKASHLAALFADLGPVSGGGFEQIDDAAFDIVINATAASLQGVSLPLSPNVLHSKTCCYDMMYADSDTAFIQWAKHHGAAKSFDGLGMLVEQAAEAFFVWRQVRVETQPVIIQLRSSTNPDHN